MESLGIGTGEFVVLFFIMVFSVGLPVISLIDLARKKLTGTPLAIWVLIICAVPVLGSVAYWVIRPTAESRV
jgi:hypothetical protein